jgi:hypothetical protein
LPQTCRAVNRDYLSGRLKIVLLILLLTALAGASGCKSASGSREFIPGRGWKTNG